MPDTDYNIIKARTSEGLIDVVKGALSEGWGILGEAMFIPAAYNPEGGPLWYQTLYKSLPDTEITSNAPIIEVTGFGRY